MLRSCLPLFVLLVLPLPATIADAPASSDQAFVELHRTGALFDRKQYKKVRAAFARAFEQKHAETIRAAFGENYAKLTGWLNSKPDIKEDLYTAIDERDDDVATALRLFAGLWKDYPSQIESWSALAIATAVVWDRPASVYDYRHHQVRTKSTMPQGAADAKANFDYLVNGGKGVLSTIKVLPWEFLVFVVDHKTPIEERQWAQQYVAGRRGRVSSWHQDIAYDHGMLKTEQTGKGPGPKLAGHEYTLANIKRYGGVCAQQADFVARVGKSVGQPTIYVSGESSYRGWHAWVMWVSVAKAGASGVRFSLVSDGRTRGFERDAFYVGHLTDPHTGKRILDRDMERKLSVVGADPLAQRQAKLAMRAYPIVVKAASLDVKDRIAFLDRCLQVCPRAEELWREFARMAKEGELSGTWKSVATARLATFTRSFAHYPDFIARLSDDLLTPDEPAAKIKHYSQVAAICEKAGRPDLVCETRLKISQLYSEQNRWKEATQALSLAVNKYPTEGRYIPRLLQAYEKVCENYEQGVKPLANLYVKLGPALVLHYRGERNKFLDQVINQATRFLEEKKLDKLAEKFQTAVALAKSRTATVK
jgi:tetratricopeptide (TPR) repeat protein